MSNTIKITSEGTEILPSSLEARIEARVREQLRMIDGDMSDAALMLRSHNYKKLTETYCNYHSEFGKERYIDALVMCRAYKRLAEARGLPTGEAVTV